MHRLFSTIVLVLLFGMTAFAQDAPGTKFPAQLDSQESLVKATNNARTTLTGAITSSATSISVAATAKFPTSGVIQIDDEIIYYTSKSSTAFNGLTRAADGSTAASHLNGASVRGVIAAIHHMAMADALRAIEAKLGSGSSTPTANQFLVGTGAGTDAWRALLAGDITPLLGSMAQQNSTGISVTGGVETGVTHNGGIFNSPVINTGTFNSPTFISPTFTGTTTAHIINADEVNATTITGSGAGVTGVVSVGAGTGTSSTAGLTFRSNSDNSGTDGTQSFITKNAVTAFQINDNGTSNFGGNLGIGVSAPATTGPRLSIAGTGTNGAYPGSGAMAYKIKGLSDAGSGDFNFGMYGTTFNGVKGQSQYFGVNMSSVDTVETAGLAGFGLSFEMNWKVSGTAGDIVDEAHLSYIGADGGAHRPYTYYISRLSNTAYLWNRLDRWDLYDFTDIGNSAYVRFDRAGSFINTPFVQSGGMTWQKADTTGIMSLDGTTGILTLGSDPASINDISFDHSTGGPSGGGKLTLTTASGANRPDLEIGGVLIMRNLANTANVAYFNASGLTFSTNADQCINFASGAKICSGTGTPPSADPDGSIWIQTDSGGALFMRQSGAWVGVTIP